MNFSERELAPWRSYLSWPPQFDNKELRTRQNSIFPYTHWTNRVHTFMYVYNKYTQHTVSPHVRRHSCVLINHEHDTDMTATTVNRLACQPSHMPHSLKSYRKIHPSMNSSDLSHERYMTKKKCKYTRSGMYTKRCGLPVSLFYEITRRVTMS